MPPNQPRGFQSLSWPAVFSASSEAKQAFPKSSQTPLWGLGLRHSPCMPAYKAEDTPRGVSQGACSPLA